MCADALRSDSIRIAPPFGGGLNVAPEPIDVYYPDRRANDPDFHIDAREAYRHASAGDSLICVAGSPPIGCSTRIGTTSETLLH